VSASFLTALIDWWVAVWQTLIGIPSMPEAKRRHFDE
jgi:hypothetical protein